MFDPLHDRLRRHVALDEQRSGGHQQDDQRQE
jgi:hypothetical protein